jgi:hypothetical protein
MGCVTLKTIFYRIICRTFFGGVMSFFGLSRDIYVLKETPHDMNMVNFVTIRVFNFEGEH